MPASTPIAANVRRRTGAALLVAAAITAAVLVGAQRVIGWSTFAHTAGAVPYLPWVTFAALMTGSYFARAVRLWTLMRRIGRHTSLRSSATLFLVHNALVTFLPARLGEAALPILAHRWAALDWRPVIGALAWWRLTDLTVIAALALSLLALGATALAPLSLLAAAACALPFVAFALRHWLARKDAWAARTPHLLGPLLHRVAHGMPGSWRAVGVDFTLAVISWVLKIGGLATLLVAAVAAASPEDAGALAWPRVAAAVVAGDVAGALPLPSLGSIGPYEAGVVTGLLASGLALDRAFAAALLVHGALLGTVLLGALVGTGLRVLPPSR